MVQISLFDFEGPPEPISGEAFKLSPLDIFAFAPIGAIGKTGEKLTTGFISQITKLFAPKTVLPATKGLTTVASTGARGGGAPFRVSGGFSSTSTAKLVSPAVKETQKGFPIFKPFTNPFQGKVNTNLALGTGALGLGTAGLFTLTQTPGGQDLTENIGDFGASVTKFATENPLIIAAALGLGALVVLK